MTRPYHFLGDACDFDQEVIDALEAPEPPEPLVVVDDSEGIEE